MDTQRLILLFIFGFSVLMLWENWQREHAPKPPPAAAAQQPGVPSSPAAKPAAAATPSAPGSIVAPAGAPAVTGETIRVTTDLVVAEIDTLGGTLKRLELLRHKDSNDPDKNFVLISPAHLYEAQSGLTGDGGPNHRTLWRADAGPRELAAGADSVQVRLNAAGKDGMQVEKVYTFHRNSYVIDLQLHVVNRGAAPVASYAYFQLTHDGKPEGNRNSVAETFGAQSFTGFAVYSEEHKYQKVSPADIDKGKADYVKSAKDGWLALVQHYFVSAWLAPAGVQRDYLLEKRQDASYAGRMLVPVNVAAGADATVDVPLYAGPQEKRRLDAAAPGLELVVDYGSLKVIAWPLFWLLEHLHALTGNWGVAIILLTVIIKLVFFPLSAASYK